MVNIAFVADPATVLHSSRARHAGIIRERNIKLVVYMSWMSRNSDGVYLFKRDIGKDARTPLGMVDTGKVQSKCMDNDLSSFVLKWISFNCRTRDSIYNE